MYLCRNVSVLIFNLNTKKTSILLYLNFEIDVKARYCFVMTKPCNSRAVGRLRFRN